MLASSPAKSPQLHSSPSSSTSRHYRIPSNTSSYSPRQNASSSSPRVGSLRKPQPSPSVSARIKTRDASTQYSPQEQVSVTGDKKGKGVSKMADSSNQSTVSSEENTSALHSTPPIKRTSGEARLTSASSSEPLNPQKRAKQEVSADKILPAQYEHCDPDDLVVMLSHMIADLVRINDPNHLTNSRLTRFHSRVAPGISAQDYLKRLATHLALQPVILLTMCFYMDRLGSFYSDFIVNSLTCHRFLITAATVATKGLSDSFWNNSTYARVGGVKLSELALLELEFLHRVDWRIIPDNDTLVSYYHGLITRTDGYSLAESRPTARLTGPPTSERQKSSYESDASGSTPLSPDSIAVSDKSVPSNSADDAAGAVPNSVTVDDNHENVGTEPNPTASCVKARSPPTPPSTS